MTVEHGQRIGIEDKPERWPMTASIAVLLRPDAKGNGLLLVRIGGQWGIPAGHLKPDENLLSGIRREVSEETGLRGGNILFKAHHLYGQRFDELGGLVTPEIAICLPSEERTQLGLVYQAVYHGPKLDREGWPVGDEKVEYAKPFSMRELLALVEDHIRMEEEERGGRIYKPHFNFHLILFWIDKASIKGYGHPEFVDKWARRMSARIPGIQLIPASRSPFRETDSIQWGYRFPYFGEQSPEAVKRSRGLKWGR